MGDTVKLFYEDSFLREFEATVLSCQSDKKGYKAVLDRTAFFPEGGGQYGDQGKIDGKEVYDTHEKDGVIYHYMKEPLEEGSVVRGKINWEIRFDRMQQHSGEHMISGIVHRRFGYENVGFHLGEDYCTMDFNGPIDRSVLYEIEEEVNRKVFENIPVQVLYPADEELDKIEYRSKIEIDGQVRIIEIPGVDTCACCAPHVQMTGQIGMIKIVDVVRYKGGERVTMLAGMRALRDYQMKQNQVKQISAVLCEKAYQVGDAVEKLKEDCSRQKSELLNLKKQLLGVRAKEIEITGDRFCIFDENLSGDEPRELMNLLLERGVQICGVFAGTDEAGYRYVIGSRTEDVRPINGLLREKFGARGGGKPEMVQGSLTGTESDIRALF